MKLNGFKDFIRKTEGPKPNVIKDSFRKVYTTNLVIDSYNPTPVEPSTLEELLNAIENDIPY